MRGLDAGPGYLDSAGSLLCYVASASISCRFWDQLSTNQLFRVDTDRYCM